MSESETYDLRTNAVFQYQQFIESCYIHSMSVFGKIEDGKPWRGANGFSYSQNVKSIEGFLAKSLLFPDTGSSPA
ncbi:hypothetical protein [Desulfobacterium sp. N47]|uniref:Uncharacterized protein n=1 Tax=uncultured Desulfobacterium sp. TaxID=201089 RepID=E1Y9E9_9BACT|nr:unknown protein [uncultured Desulfobacterium sp.]